jgi:hypothetical protein
MSALTGRLPVRRHLRPAPRRKVVTADDLEPRLLEMFPNIVEELNVVYVDAVPLSFALALPVGGEA